MYIFINFVENFAFYPKSKRKHGRVRLSLHSLCLVKSFNDFALSSAAFTHLPPPDPREELSSVSSVWKPGVAPRAPPSRQVLKPTVSPEHHEVTDSQPSAGLGRVLGTFSDIRTDSSGLRSTFCLHSPRNPPELC